MSNQQHYFCQASNLLFLSYVSSYMNLIFKAVVGSQAYGTALPTSDVDIKGVFLESTDHLLGFGYKKQIEVGKDETYYELRRFFQLLQAANPTVLELLYSPEDCIQYKHPVYDILLENRDKFLTIQCANSFGGYAIAQIKKARGLDKKMNWEKSRVERKTVLDFCYIYENGLTKPINHYLRENDMRQELCGLAKLNHIRDCYVLHYDYQMQYGQDSQIQRVVEPLGYKGIIGDNSNEVRLSSIPKHSTPQVLMYFNKDGYSIHCKDYREYQEWLSNRNTQRYVDSQSHGQQIDGKNLMHCVRLLDTAMEIATDKTIHIRRPNAQELLKIRRGEVKLEELLDRCEEDIKKLDNLFAASGLPKEVDKELVQNILLEIRKNYV